MKRRSTTTQRPRRRKNNHLTLLIPMIAAFLIAVSGLGYLVLADGPKASSHKEGSLAEHGVRITASGDILYHTKVLDGARLPDGSYDLDNDFEELSPILKKADMSIVDFEGAIHPDHLASGYPVFNAPTSVVSNIREAGFDTIDLAQNHILDQGLDGLRSTVELFREQGLDTFGVNYPSSAIVIKEIDGIRIALLAYTYGYNEKELSLSDEDKALFLNYYDMAKVTQQIQEAEQLADFTIVMPHAGIEYNLYPETSERENYRAMIEAGADVVLGGHPHVLQPTETIEKDGLKKFIIYSMGNTMSGMGLEENGDKWKERGVMIDFTINRDKPSSDVEISSLTLRPIVSLRSQNGRGGFDYHVHLAEDYLKDGKRYKNATQAMRDRMNAAYYETLDLLNLKW